MKEYQTALSIIGSSVKEFMLLKNTKLVNGYYTNTDELMYVAIVKADVIASKSSDNISVNKSGNKYLDKLLPKI